MKKLVFTAIMATAMALPAMAANPPRPNKMVIFGDSLVDAGNINALVGSDIFNPVAAGYFPGRFTNGPDYTDIISKHIYGSFTQPSLLGGNNFAFGGARVVNHGDPIPDLAFQLGAYFGTTGGLADPDALYIINLGGNDVFGLQSANIGAFPNSAAYIGALVATMQGSVQALANAGAGRILVTGIPNLTPTGFVVEGALQNGLNLIEPTLGTTQLLRFSYQNFFLALASNPSSFGVAPFTETGNCIGNRPVVAGVIDCTGYFSFDGVHPTAQVHRALAREIAGTVGITVPEPASWAMLIAGFGLVGATMRRRRMLAA
jgi:phospholipase/lecithinase/hemolysin